MQLKNLIHHNQHCYRFEYLSFIKSSVNSMSDGVFRKLQLKQNPSVLLYPASPLSGQALQGSAELLDNNTIFDSFVDATYIITMEENGRVNNIRAQLSKYIPTTNIYIVYNKGFKKCNKKLPEQLTHYDLIDANINIFLHSTKNKYENILILEDDFIFDKKILDRDIIIEIKNFFKENKNKSLCFNLGPIIYSVDYNTLFNSSNNIYKCNMCSNTQAVIFNKNIIKNILLYYYENKYNINNKQWDKFLNKYDVYFYKYPLSYQKLEDTENRKNWAINSNNKESLLYKIHNYILDKHISMFKLDTNPKYGFHLHYKTVYFFQYFIHYLIIFIVLSLIVYIIYYFLLKKNLFKNNNS